MPAVKELKKFYAKDRKAWRRWLESYHEKQPGVWLIYYKKGSGKSRVSYDEAVEDLAYFRILRKIPQEKITLGVPFYGYGFGPKHSARGLTMNYDDIVAEFPGAELKDELDMGDSTTLYYNGMLTIKMKTNLAKMEASGVMIWQLSGDAEGARSLLSVIYETSKGSK